MLQINCLQLAAFSSLQVPKLNLNPLEVIKEEHCKENRGKLQTALGLAYMQRAKKLCQLSQQLPFYSITKSFAYQSHFQGPEQSCTLFFCFLCFFFCSTIPGSASPGLNTAILEVHVPHLTWCISVANCQPAAFIDLNSLLPGTHPVNTCLRYSSSV